MNCEMRGARADLAAAEGNSVRADESFCGMEKQKTPVRTTIDATQLAITALTCRQTCEMLRAFRRCIEYFNRDFEVHSPAPWST